MKDNGKDEDTNISGTKFDVVRKMYGDGWRMPTPQELDELLIKTKAEWVSINDMEGYIFTGKNGKYIFLPATGVAYGNVVDDKNSGYYMSGTSANTINAYVMYLTNETFGVSNYGRFYGLRIRPVKD